MKTLQNEWHDLRDALVAVGIEIGRSMGIYKVLDWLESKFRWK